MIECRVCKEKFESPKSFHGHLKAHQLVMKTYYETYYPKKCLYTGQPIQWKEGIKFDDYQERDFLDQKCLERYFYNKDDYNMKEGWLRSNLIENCRRNKIGLCELEYRSYHQSPNIQIFSLFLDYQEECRKAGYKTRFEYPVPYYKLKLPIVKIPIEEFCLKVDSREHKPYRYFSEIRGKIDGGDYALAGKYFNNVVVERKSMSDFAGTLGFGYNRFERELKRVRESGRYLVVLVENPITDIFDYKFFSEKVRIGFLFHNLRKLFREYIDCCQFVFGGNRLQCQKLVPKILLCGEEVRKIDLQLWVTYNTVEVQTEIFSKEDLQEIYDYSS